MIRTLLIVAALIVTAAAAEPDIAVGIDNFTFGPKQLTIQAGTRVTFTNHDDIPHSIVVLGHDIHSKPLDTDDSFTTEFDQPGTYNYICGLHPQMHGTIVVQ
jgi:plastocyanin